MPVLPVGEVGQEKSVGTPCRFLNACHFWLQPYPVQNLWPWSEPETRNLRTGLLPPRVSMIAAETFQFFGRNPNPNTICKDFRIYEPY